MSVEIDAIANHASKELVGNEKSVSLLLACSTFRS